MVSLALNESLEMTILLHSEQGSGVLYTGSKQAAVEGTVRKVHDVLLIIDDEYSHGQSRRPHVSLSRLSKSCKSTRCLALAPEATPPLVPWQSEAVSEPRGAGRPFRGARCSAPAPCPSLPLVLSAR